MRYKLKEGTESFTVVDGAFRGRRFDPGMTYEDIPPQEAAKFEKVAEEKTDDSGKKIKK